MLIKSCGNFSKVGGFSVVQGFMFQHPYYQYSKIGKTLISGETVDQRICTYSNLFKSRRCEKRNR